MNGSITRACLPALVLLTSACQGVVEGDLPRGELSSGTAGTSAAGASAGGSPGSNGPNGSNGPTAELESLAQSCSAGAEPSGQFAPLARLTRREYARTLQQLLGFEVATSDLEPDGIVGLFFANTSTAVSESQVDKYRLIAEAAAEAATKDVEALTGCASDAGEACARTFLQSFGRRAFRRSLSPAEVDAYLDLYRVGVGRDGFRGGIRLAITGLLQSPWFLYRVEPSPRAASGVVKLSGPELASRLSYLITAAAPDLELLDAAESGVLASDAGLQAQTARLLSSSAGDETLAEFHSEWLKTTDVSGLEKDPAEFPSWSDELERAVAAETEQFVAYVLNHDDGRFATLLTAPYSVIDPILAPLYGVPPPTGTSKVTFNAGQRSGLLTQAAFLATKAHERQTSPVRRGIALLQSVACINLPPPPPSVVVKVPALSADATTRQRFAAHSSNPACSSCHSLIDPAGFGFENYDAIGQYRITENGQPIDSSIELARIAPDVDGSYPSLGVLLAKLVETKTARQCYSWQWFRYAFKREPAAGDACTVRRTLDAFESSGGKVRDLVSAVASSDAFRYSRKEPD